YFFFLLYSLSLACVHDGYHWNVRIDQRTNRWLFIIDCCLPQVQQTLVYVWMDVQIGKENEAEMEDDVTQSVPDKLACHRGKRDAECGYCTKEDSEYTRNVLSLRRFK